MAKTVKEKRKADQVHLEANKGRDAKGRLLKGHKISVGNSGRPKEKNRKEYLDITREFLTPDKWRVLLTKAYQDATGDDAWARAKGREFFSKQVIPQKIEMDINDQRPVVTVGVEGFTGWGEKPKM